MKTFTQFLQLPFIIQEVKQTNKSTNFFLFIWGFFLLFYSLFFTLQHADFSSNLFFLLFSTLLSIFNTLEFKLFRKYSFPQLYFPPTNLLNLFCLFSKYLIPFWIFPKQQQQWGKYFFINWQKIAPIKQTNLHGISRVTECAQEKFTRWTVFLLRFFSALLWNM